MPQLQLELTQLAVISNVNSGVKNGVNYGVIFFIK